MISTGIDVRKIEFFADRIDITVMVHPKLQRTSQIPKLAGLISKKMPRLKHHICDNEDDYSFNQELLDTELAHVFEHALIDIIGQHDHEVDVLRGLTSWDWHKMPRNTYIVSTYYTNRKTFFLALVETEHIISGLLQEAFS